MCPTLVHWGLSESAIMIILLQDLYKFMKLVLTTHAKKPVALVLFPYLCLKRMHVLWMVLSHHCSKKKSQNIKPMQQVVEWVATLSAATYKATSLECRTKTCKSMHTWIRAFGICIAWQSHSNMHIMNMFGEARTVTTAVGYCAERFWYLASSLQPALQ